jgi:hypothetical protein
VVTIGVLIKVLLIFPLRRSKLENSGTILPDSFKLLVREKPEGSVASNIRMLKSHPESGILSRYIVLATPVCMS